MKTLLAIIAIKRDEELLRRHWQYFVRTGFNILGVGPKMEHVEWPSEVPRLDTGLMGKKQTPAGSVLFGLPAQEMDIWQYFLDHKEYDSVCVVESDNLFCRKPPEHPGDGIYLVTQLPNYCRPGLFRTPWYASTPRWADRIAAEKLLKHGRAMFARGEHEWWVSDRFPAAICQKHGIPWMGQPAWSPLPSVTTPEQWVRDARAAIKIGCYALHSVKTAEQLAAIEDLLFPDTENQSATIIERLSV